MRSYTPQLVERILQNYLDIICTLEGSSQQLSVQYTYHRHIKRKGEQPFGQTQNGKPWPFMEPVHAHAPVDGKSKAQLMAELHVSVLDLEAAFPRLSDDDQDILKKYYLYKTHTLDQLKEERDVASRGSMQQRVFRAVKRLAHLMEYAYGRSHKTSTKVFRGCEEEESNET